MLLLYLIMCTFDHLKRGHLNFSIYQLKYFNISVSSFILFFIIDIIEYQTTTKLALIIKGVCCLLQYQYDTFNL